ncbi:MAG: hypothetical protein QHH06_09895 [Clostridiales bacterium]|nr:hypothetical protein [Eubacteriales bacterium]MDH7566776.1 hypothetical protein [Clostridiales bacterium]
MKKFHGTASVGLREKSTGKLVAAYPYPVSGKDTEIEQKVRFWYYQQSCSAEEELRDCYVDLLTEKELKDK